MEEGTPFCPHCSAPQIRVVIPDPGQASAPSDANQNVQPIAAAPGNTMPGAPHFASAMRPCVIAAMLGALSMFLGLPFPAATLGAGFLAVALYRWRTAGPVRAGLGARLGAISGALCFGVLTAFISLAATVPDLRSRMRDQFLEVIQKTAESRPGNTQVQAVLDQIKTPEGFITVLIIWSVLLLIFSIVLATVGGALGGAILSRRDPT